MGAIFVCHKSKTFYYDPDSTAFIAYLDNCTTIGVSSMSTLEIERSLWKNDGYREVDYEEFYNTRPRRKRRE